MPDENDEVVDEKLLPPEGSSFELEEVYLPKQYPFKLQVALYQAINEDMELNAGKYKQIEKTVQKRLINFLLAYLKINTYYETAK